MERMVKKNKLSDINPQYKNYNLDDFYVVDNVSFEYLIEIQDVLKKLYIYEEREEIEKSKNTSINIGDIVWWIDKILDEYVICKCEVIDFETCEIGYKTHDVVRLRNLTNITNITVDEHIVFYNYIGKSIFKNKQDAEKRLKEIKQTEEEE